MAARMTEAELQQAIVDNAGWLGWLVYHTYDSRRSVKGFPDLVLVRPPRLLIVELKNATEQRKPEQVVWGDQLEQVAAEVGVLQRFGAVPLIAYRLWRPVDWTSGAVEAELAREARAVSRRPKSRRRVLLEQFDILAPSISLRDAVRYVEDRRVVAPLHRGRRWARAGERA